MKQNKTRPLSPHLTIYRPSLCILSSISHRFAGIGLFLSLLFISWTIIIINFLPKTNHDKKAIILEIFFGYYNSCFLKLFAFLAILAFIYHSLNGIRHILWDSGKYLSMKESDIGSIIVIFATVIFTMLIYFL